MQRSSRDRTSEKGQTDMKRWTEIVRSFPKLIAGKSYRTRVHSIKKRPRRIEVILEFLDSPQRERRVTINLSRPIRPDGITAEFFGACNITVSPEARITPRSTINCELLVTFCESTADSSWQPKSFKPVSKGEENATVQSQSPVPGPDIHTIC